MTTLALVCEGPCNAHEAALRELVTTYRQREGRAIEGLLPPPTRDVVGALRQLVHTGHVVKNDEWAACEACGHIRRHNRVFS